MQEQANLVDVVFNKPFKKAIDAMANNRLQENLDDYLRGRITASEIKILLKWFGKAWEEISAKEDRIICSFKKCGISVAIDGLEDDQIHINTLNDYNVGESDDEATDDEATDNNSDPFKDLD